MLGSKQLQLILSQLDNPAISGLFYRAIPNAALYSKEPPQPLWSLGPGLYGQRFNAIGSPPALYVAEQPQTAFYEATGLGASLFSVNSQDRPTPAPTTVLTIKVNLEHVLDLTKASIITALGMTQSEILCPWQEFMIKDLPVPTHILADAVYQSGRYQGIRFPSSKETGAINLMIWMDKIKTPSFVEVHDPSGRLWQRVPGDKT
jgi:RES domain-containing protein